MRAEHAEGDALIDEQSNLVLDFEFDDLGQWADVAAVHVHAFDDQELADCLRLLRVLLQG